MSIYVNEKYKNYHLLKSEFVMKNKILTKVILACQTCSQEDCDRYLNVDGTFSIFDDYLTKDEIDYLNAEMTQNEQFIYDLDSISQSILTFRLRY